MAKYTWKDNQWIDKDTGLPMEAPDRVAIPMVRSDLKPYFSVASGKWVDGHAARREDLKRTGCRPVDPAEYRVETARTKKWADRLKVDWVPDDGPKRMSNIVDQ